MTMHRSTSNRSRLLWICVSCLVSVSSLTRPATAATAEYSQIARLISPAVVYVEVVYRSGRKVSGSGFVVHPDGWILTARHVIANAKRIEVTFLPGVLGRPGSIYDLLFPQPPLRASVIASLEEVDMALLKVRASGLPYVPLQNPIEFGGNLDQGDEVLVFGFPGGRAIGTADVTVTRGIVSAFRSDTRIPLRLIQIDAVINPGNSGGPVAAVKTGKVMAMAFARIPEFQGINFALDIYGGLLLLKIPGGASRFRWGR